MAYGRKNHTNRALLRAHSKRIKKKVESYEILRLWTDPVTPADIGRVYAARKCGCGACNSWKLRYNRAKSTRDTRKEIEE